MGENLKKPEFKKTESKRDIIKLAKERLLNKPLLISLPTLDEKFGEIIEAAENGLLLRFANFIPPSDNITLTAFINGFYCEIEVTAEKMVKESLFLCRANFLRISSQRRMESRCRVTGDEICIRRIKIAKTELNITPDSIPAGYKAVLEKFEKKCAGMADVVTIAPFGKKTKILDEVYKTGATYFMPDARREISLDLNRERNSDIIDLRAFYGDTWKTERRNLQNKNIIGRIVLPILGPQTREVWIPVGYIDLVSKTPFDFIKLMETKTLSFQIIEELLSMNIDVFDEKVRLVDVSKSGMCIHITNRALVDIMLIRQQFICNIILKGQAPITVDCWIRMNKKLDDGSMLVGVKIQGETHRKDQMLRYWDYIKTLEKKPKG